ncbi:electron transporter RnfG [Candidatus Saganbacteria bacterium CG08_land_8_20_14_0_20_45_16]|uniref:Ion-translocating oxidoreductase complex subunit G n=1 Tax=Candidatus Saganbacteria bacterium CG08_land_8_20_14_0_20_45_16 TaxID=2014293 RepID=A0A2H0Y026_UNCSA|nr:MAG: electron transporter RnfG [Candidatus Saganbacteria bacterium CG08_land_8_20_14_0_20_45_16]
MKILKMIVVLTLIGLISGGVLAYVYQWAELKIAANQVRETDAAVFKVVPGTKSYKTIAKDDLTYFECFDDVDGKLGTAILCQGNGYQGVIKLIVGVNADFSKFTGMSVLEQLETPGLGAKISEAVFQAQFNNLAARPPIEYVKGISPSKPNEIQAITGATISSRSVVNIINKTIEEWLRVK